jgi:hypothetical protein
MGQSTGSSQNAMEIPGGVMKPKAKDDPTNPYKKLAKGMLGGLGTGLEQQQNQNNQNAFFGGY